MAPVLTCRYSGALCLVFPLQIHMVGTSIRVNGHLLQRCPQSHAAILLLCCSVSPTLHHLVCLLCLLYSLMLRGVLLCCPLGPLCPPLCTPHILSMSLLYVTIRTRLIFFLLT